MPTYTQTQRPLEVTTPLGKDKLLLVGLAGQDALSQLFDYSLDVAATKGQDVPFDKLLGQSVTARLELPSGSSRYFNGLVNRVSQGSQDERFTHYRIHLVPQLWLLTRVAQSRIFQQKAVPDILKEVLKGIDCRYELQGTFQPRDYCVQYRETDFNFASRLMEEEGIYYFFQHNNGEHKMVLANTPQSHSDVPERSTITFETISAGHLRGEDRIYDWQKVQQLCSGKHTLWDHIFELPHQHLEATKSIQSEVAAGKVTHKLQVGGNDKLEVYDWPGGYAQRFDGIDPGGGERSSDLQKIFQDNSRTVGIRMQETAAGGLLIHGASGCRQLASGFKFTLTRHFNADGAYVLTGVNHSATLSADYVSGNGEGFRYHNSFTCIPIALPYRPPRTTAKPVVQGTQSAVVVGTPGEEIFTDKYGRVKVQFHWDRQGKNDANSSCWVRVGSIWAGKTWGGIHIPRVGQEVLVAFEEGDPDRPIIIGSVYNSDMMPPYKLPDNKTVSGLQTRSTLKGESANFNELRFEDKKSSEYVYFHAEKDFHRFVENDDNQQVGNDRKQLVKRDQHIQIKRHQSEHIGGNWQLTVGHGDSSGGNVDLVYAGKKSELVEKDNDYHVKANRNEKVDGNMSFTIGGNQQEKVGQNHALDAGQEIHLKAGMKVILEAGMQLTIKGPGGFVDIGPAGVTIQGTMVLINSGGSAGAGSGSSPTSPQDAQQAQPADPQIPQLRLGT